MTEAPTLADVVEVNIPPDCVPVFDGTFCKPGSTGTLVNGSAFTHSLAPLPDRSAIVSLSDLRLYGAAVGVRRSGSQTADPVDRERGGRVVAGGSRRPLYDPGHHLSPTNVASGEIPLPTLLGDSCMTINGELVPMVFASPGQINGQIPFATQGSSTMILRTPAGVGNFDFDIQDQAPSVFRVSIAGSNALTATIVRAKNNLTVTPSNPIHLDDRITIYATGMGLVTPDVNSGDPGPSSPLAQTVVPPVVTLGGVNLPIEYAGLAPGQVGVYQINAIVPFKGVPTGPTIPLKIEQSTFSTSVNVRVVQH